MLTVFTALVWVPAVVATPGVRFPWTALLVSWAISAGAWAVAGSLAGPDAGETPAWRRRIGRPSRAPPAGWVRETRPALRTTGGAGTFSPCAGGIARARPIPFR